MVALKVLPLAATLDPRRLQRFQHEAQAAACLHHTNIVPVYFVGSERGVHFYAMQLIDGQTLAAVIHDQCRVGEQGTRAGANSEYNAATARALDGETGSGRGLLPQGGGTGSAGRGSADHAHQMGVVHRDVKPANLMLDGRGTVWVTDFGLALLQTEAGVTLTGDLVGTLRYMSPEQALAKRVLIDHRTDVYSLGATLYEMLTLRPVFVGDDRQELLRQIAFDEPLRPRRLNRAIPAELETIVLKSLEKNRRTGTPPLRNWPMTCVTLWTTGPFGRSGLPCCIGWDDGAGGTNRWCEVSRFWCVRCYCWAVSAWDGSCDNRPPQNRRSAKIYTRPTCFSRRSAGPRSCKLAQRVRATRGGRATTSAGARQQRRKNVAMVARLEEARLWAFAAVKGGFDYKGADEAYAAAFTSYDLNLDAWTRKRPRCASGGRPSECSLLRLWTTGPSS